MIIIKIKLNFELMGILFKYIIVINKIYKY